MDRLDSLEKIFDKIYVPQAVYDAYETCSHQISMHCDGDRRNEGKSTEFK